MRKIGFGYDSDLLLGTNMVKWTKKVLRYTKAIVFLVKCLKVVAKCSLD